MFIRKTMTFMMLFIVLISLFATYVGETLQDESKLSETTSVGNLGGVFKDSRGTRAESSNVDLLSRLLYGEAIDVKVVGNFAYVGVGYNLMVFDISDKSDPNIVGSVETNSYAAAVQIVDSLAFVADAYYGLSIFDISNPLSPSRRGGYQIEEGFMAYDISVSGSMAYLATFDMSDLSNEDNGITAIDISNTANPTFAGHYSGTTVTGLSVIGSTVYAACYLNGLRIIDMSDPDNPMELGRNETNLAIRIDVSGETAYVASITNLWLVDVSDPADPRGYSTYDTGALDVYVVNNDAFVAGGDSGLSIIDVSNPNNPSLRGSSDTEGFAQGIYVLDDYAFIADQFNGFVIFDISNPNSPSEEGTFHTGDFPEGVVVNGNLAYVGADSTGLRIYDISDPLSPVEIGYLEDGLYPEGVTLRDDYIYLVDWDELVVVNVADPGNPFETGNAWIDGYYEDIFLDWPYAYVAVGEDGVSIVNVNDPLNPFEDTVYGLATEAMGVHVSDDYLFIANGDNGLNVVDVSNPSSPTHRASHATPDTAMDVFVKGNYAYIAINESGLRILDISTPTSPSFVADFNTMGNAMGVFVAGDHAYVVDGSEGLRVIDVMDPNSPSEVGYYDTEGFAKEVFVYKSVAYIGSIGGGLFLLDVSFFVAPPQIVSTYPDDGSENIHINTSIFINFSKSMVKSSVESAFSYTDGVSTWNVLDGEGSWSNSDKTFTFKPNNTLATSVQYMLTVSYTAIDTDGLLLDGDGDGIPGEISQDNYTWSFSTIPTPPNVVSTFPQHDTTLIPTDASIIMNFSKSMDFESIKKALSYSDGDVVFESTNGQLIPTNDDKTMIFTPFVKFQYDTVYTFTVNHSAFDVDLAFLDGDNDGIGGEGEEDDYIWSFRTTPVPPRVSSVIPSKLATKVPVGTWINITFSKTMDETLVEEAFTYTHEDTNITWDASDGNVSWGDDSKIMRFKPSQELEYAKEYTVSIEATAKDDEGINLPFYFWIFTTIPESPKVLSVEPEDDSDEVAIDVDIVINFDKAMDTDTMKNAFSYTHSGTTEDFKITSGTAIWTNSEKTLTFSPDVDFEEGETYTVTIDNTAKDKEGIRFEEFSWSFTTKINSAPVLQGGGVHPEEGDTSDKFKFSIIYRDDDDDEPEEINVIINGISWKMYESDPKEEDFIAGKTYEYELELDEGEHEYYFEAADEKHEVRFPTGQTNKKLEVSAVEEELVFGVFEEDYMGMPTLICGPLGIIIIVAIIIALMMMRRRGRAQRQIMTFDAIDTGGEAPMTFMPAPQEEIMSFMAFEEEPSLEEAKPVVIQCPECNQHLKVKATTRPFMFPCKCGAKLILK
ncbi:MAG: Ig-like domain-containing protein [Thermoplasmata archaeon]|nr:MAG: Ig-like domain-containing protein [Thermoplasmata archaeon]